MILMTNESHMTHNDSVRLSCRRPEAHLEPEAVAAVRRADGEVPLVARRGASVRQLPRADARLRPVAARHGVRLPAAPVARGRRRARRVM